MKIKELRMKTPKAAWHMIKEDSKQKAFTTGVLCGMIVVCIAAALAIAFLT